MNILWVHSKHNSSPVYGTCCWWRRFNNHPSQSYLGNTADLIWIFSKHKFMPKYNFRYMRLIRCWQKYDDQIWNCWITTILIYWIPAANFYFAVTCVSFMNGDLVCFTSIILHSCELYLKIFTVNINTVLLNLIRDLTIIDLSQITEDGKYFINYEIITIF